MVCLYLEELTEDKVSYRYYPEERKEYGIVSLMRKTGKRIHDVPCSDSISMYARHAWKRLEEMGEFLEKGLVFWY